MPKTTQTQQAAATPTAGAETVPSTKYRQLAAQLRDLIDSGALPPGALMPSEPELMQRYALSQPTVRSALRELRNQGLIVTYRGRGSFVRRPDARPTYTLARTISRDRAGAYHDGDPDAEVWRPAEEPATYRLNATADLALALGVAEHAPLFGCDRLLADPAGRRIAHRLYLPFDTCHGVEALTEDPFREPADLYAILECAGRNLTWTEHVRARNPAPDDAATLRITDGTPMITVRRYTRDADGATLAMEETRLSAEDTQLAYPITPAGAGRQGHP